MYVYIDIMTLMSEFAVVHLCYIAKLFTLRYYGQEESLWEALVL